MPSEAENKKWREETEQKIRHKLGLAVDAPTSNRPEYWQEWQKAQRCRETALAAPLEFTLSDDQITNYSSYGWPLPCSICRLGITDFRGVDCNGISFLCHSCGKPNIVERQGNKFVISPGKGARLIDWVSRWFRSI